MATKSRLLTASISGLRVAVTALLTFWLGAAWAQTPFYQGKTITIIQGRDPGGTGDIRVKAVVPFLQKFIPGNPSIVSEFMPGGGSRKAANHIFRTAQPDGLTIGNLGSGIVVVAILGEAGVLYDLDKFIYLGSPFSAHQSIFVSRKDAGLSSIEKLRAASGIRIGGQSVGFTTYNEGRLFAYMLGLKEPKFVTGYGGAELDPALMRGEIDARAIAADGVLRNPEWLEKNFVDFHAIIEVPKGDKHPQFASVPEIESFAKSEKHRRIITMQRAFRLAGQPFVLPPGTPKEPVQILREAFRRVYTDPEFLKQYKKFTANDASPLMPEAYEKVIRDIPRDPEVIDIFKRIVGAGPLPPQ